MTGIIVADHGYFPTRLLSTIMLVAGRSRNAAGVDFLEGRSPSDLKEAMIGFVRALEGKEILILANLVGKTSLSVAVIPREELRDRRIKMMVGVNMMRLVEAVFPRPVYGLDEPAAAILAAGREGTGDLDYLDSEGQEPEFEDGL